MVVVSVLFVIIGLCVGYLLGAYGERSSLLIGADEVTRTPHKLGGKFYYLVPEREYCLLENAYLRSTQGDFDSNGRGLLCL
jgi:hypothetical protein